MNYFDYLERAARLYPITTAIQDDAGTARSFSDLLSRAEALAAALIARGIVPGDRVADIQWNRLEVLDIDFGLARAGAVRVPMNSRLSEHDISYLLEESQPSAMIFGDGFEALAAFVRQRFPAIKILVGPEAEGVVPYRQLLAEGSDLLGKGNVRFPVITGDAPLTIAYTGGTTGKPKAAVRSHSAQIAIALNILAELCSFRREDVLLQVQPLSHGAGPYILPAVMRGTKQVIHGRFDPHAVLRMIDEGEVTCIKLVPTMLIRLVECFPQVQPDTSRLRRIIYGASPMPEAPLRRALELFGPVLAQTYGQSEAPSTIARLSPADHACAAANPDSARLRSVGRPYSSIDVSIIGEHGREVGIGEVGEIKVRGPMIMSGYWMNEEATANSLRDGWIHTGDLGFFDEGRYLYLVDRKNDVIITGGFNVYPSEVEQVLYRHEAVSEVAVVGVPDEDWGEAVTAVVRLRENANADESELLGYARGILSGFKVPKRVHIWDELPVSSAGKIVRRKVRELLTAETGGSRNDGR